jgi:hypothetical protein
VNATDLTRALLTGFAEPRASSGASASVTDPSGTASAERFPPGSAVDPTSPARAIGPTPLGPPVAIPLPAQPHPPADLSTTLHRRRAQRVFGVEDVAAALLLDCVAAGLAADREHWPDEQGCCDLWPVLVAQRVDGLPRAVYELDPLGRTATPVMDLPTVAAAEALTLQREFAAASAVVALLSDVDGAECRHGAHGYRRLMTRAGAAVYTVWLEAVARGLIGSVFAGFLPAAVRVPLRCDGVSRHQLFAVALGAPAPVGEPGPPATA